MDCLYTQVSKRPKPITVRHCGMPKNCVLNLGLERRERKDSQNILSKEFLVPIEECDD